MSDIIILGGYGNFGKRIARALAQSANSVIIAGRDARKASALAETLRKEIPDSEVRGERIDAERNFAGRLIQNRPSVVVNTIGPFQHKRYDIAEACIASGVHYIDLADGRDFVTGITALDARAKATGACVVSGASTVPGLSSAVVEYYRRDFATIDSMRFGISPGQKAERGLATTQSILTYVGREMKPSPGQTEPRYGWQDAHKVTYPGLGDRWMANCDVPDLDLLPAQYGIKSIHFSAGMENPVLHFGLWGMGRAVRLGLPLHPEKHAATLLRMSHWFDSMGTDSGGMHVFLDGTDAQGQPVSRRWFIIAGNGDGPQIPCVPAILLARKFARQAKLEPGAKPCVGLVSLEDYLAELASFSITTHADERTAPAEVPKQEVPEEQERPRRSAKRKTR
jgi:hypothetical protein